ncbi:HLH, partial [Musa troglodytarum]
MSSRRARSRQSTSSSRIADEQINDLVCKLQAVLPESRIRGADRISAARVLQETCNYIRSLHRDVDDLSERLSELLNNTEASSAQAAIIRSLLICGTKTGLGQVEFLRLDWSKTSLAEKLAILQAGRLNTKQANHGP